MTVVTATTGRAIGSRPSGRLREEGQLPGVIYGKGIEPTPLHVDYAELREALKGAAGLNTIFTLVVDGTENTVIVRDIQRDAIKRTVAHADFLRVDDADKIKVTVPVTLTGRAVEVLENGGIIEQKMHTLKILVDPKKVPNQIEVDVTNLSLDSRIALGDIDLPDGVSTKVSDRITIAAPVVPRGLKSAEEEEEELLEGEEGEAAEGADGQEASDDASDD
jgi:large subunit ribosomal protein L25